MNASAAAAVSIQGYLADGGDSPSDIDPTTGKGPEWGEAAPVGLLVVVLLCVAVYFLVKSMNRNLKKVPESFATVAAPVAVGVGAAGVGAAGVDTTGGGDESVTSSAPASAAGGAGPADATSGSETPPAATPSDPR